VDADAELLSAAAGLKSESHRIRDRHIRSSDHPYGGGIAYVRSTFELGAAGEVFARDIRVERSLFDWHTALDLTFCSGFDT
jgi:hypothetical protein